MLEQAGSQARCWDTLLRSQATVFFAWSGLNSEARRTFDAQQLAERVIELSAKPNVRKIHFVAHSHGGNLLIKAFLLFRKHIAREKLGSFIFLGTPFFSYKSINPSKALFRRLLRNFIIFLAFPLLLTDKKPNLEEYSGTFFAISSKYDEVLKILQHSIELRDRAFLFSRRWTKKAPSDDDEDVPTSPLSLLTTYELGTGIAKKRSLLTERLTERYFFYFNLIHACVAPIASILRHLAQLWGIYFGLKAMAAASLGDDLAFERILAVTKVSDVVPITMLELSDEQEEALLERTVVGTDQLLSRIYQKLASAPAELGFAALPGAISEIFRSKELVHAQYYADERIIKMVAEAISGRNRLKMDDMP
jgi:hypothetical protein